MSISSIFYTEKINLFERGATTSDAYGRAKEQEPVMISEDVPCCITPLNVVKTQEKWGILNTSSLEFSLDIFDGLDIDKVKYIDYQDIRYKVLSYEIYTEFMILPASVTFVCKRVEL